MGGDGLGGGGAELKSALQDGGDVAVFQAWLAASTAASWTSGCSKKTFIPQQLYGVTQRGNQGQWVYRDDQDFRKALDLMARYSARHGVNIHGWCLMHNHGHWIFEAFSEDSISNLMRDMPGCYSRYLNRRYQKEPWKLLAPLTLYGRRARKMYSPYRRAGPGNWTPRFDAMCLFGAGFQMFLRYVENNPVRARMARKATDWAWSSARAHCAGKDAGGVLCLDVWRHLFGNPAVDPAGAAVWTAFLEGPEEEVRRNAGRRPVPYNRIVGWVAPVVSRGARTPKDQPKG